MKRVDFNINKRLSEYILKPLRKKEDFILLLLETIKLFYVQEMAASQGKVIIVVSKMSRIFYQTDNKMFSIAFPFGLEELDGEYKIYDMSCGIDIDSKVISIMKSILLQLKSLDVSVEGICDVYCEVGGSGTEGEDADMDIIWKILLRLLSAEPGYIRYDYDEKNESENHPLNHFDINYSSDVTYKIGLKKKVGMEYMVSLLDVNSECRYLE